MRHGNLLGVSALMIQCGVLIGCDDECTRIRGETRLYRELSPDRSLGFLLPAGEPIATLSRGEVVEVEWINDAKDDFVLKVKRTDGTVGFIFNRQDEGQFSLPESCDKVRPKSK